MRSHASRFCRIALTLSCAFAALAPHVSHAEGAVLGRGQQASISSARFAVALGTDRTTRWMELSVRGTESGFLWLLPVAAGARVDLSSRDWLDALDQATTPTILPPLATPPCEATTTPEQLTQPPLPGSVSPTAAGIAVDSATLAGLVAAGGASLSSEQSAAFEGVFQSGLAVLVLGFDSKEDAATTQTIQIVEPGSRALDLPSTSNPEPITLATTFVVGSSRAATGPTPLILEASGISWSASGVSSYATTRAEALTAASGALWLTESAVPGHLFAPLDVEGAPTFPSVVGQYFTLASPTTNSEATLECEQAAAQLAASNAPVEGLCPPGAVATLPGPSPCAASGVADDAGASPVSLVCGPRVTAAAFALAGLTPSSLWVTRATGLLPASGGGSLVVGPTSDPAVSPVITASSYDSSCPAVTLPSAPSVQSASTTAPASSGDDGDDDSDDLSDALGDDDSDDNGDDSSDAVADGVTSGGCDGSSSDPSSDEESSGCDSHSDDDSSSGCSGSSSDSDPGCTMHRSGRATKGAGVRFLVVGAGALAFLRRRGRKIAKR